MHAFPATRDRAMPVDFLSLSLDCMREIEDRVRNSNALLNKSQCGYLSSKLVETIENVKALISNCGESSTPFIPAIRNLYKISEKAKRLVCNCSNEKWRDASLIFQLRNDEAFQEILLEMGLCYNVIREQAEGMRGKGDPQVEDLRKSSTFSPASEEKVRKDREDFREVLVRLASTISSSNHREKYLAEYLLRKLDCPPEHDQANELGISTSAILWVEETEPAGTWELNGFLGRGSGACGVLKAKWLDIPCAKKVFCTEMQMPIFLREAGILSRLSHPNIVNFFCCSNGPDRGQCFIGMELMQMSLSDLIKYEAKKVRKSFPLSVALDIIVQIARGMCYLHDSGIAHRDLKPSNMLVNILDTPHLEDNICVKLGDLGMSKTKVEVSKSNTISIRGVGTPTYRAPEVHPKAQNPTQGPAKALWFKADVYSFGVTSAEVLSLTTQFEGIDLSDMCRELERGARPELPSHPLEKLVSLLTQCRCEGPHSRPTSTDICIRLEEVRHDLSRGSTSPAHRGLQEGGIDPIGYEYIEEMLRKYEHQRQKHSAEQPDSPQFAAFDEK
jgi:serine/threonine protein kinase